MTYFDLLYLNIYIIENISTIMVIKNRASIPNTKSGKYFLTEVITNKMNVFIKNINGKYAIIYLKISLNFTLTSPTHSSANHISDCHSGFLGHPCGLGYELRG